MKRFRNWFKYRRKGNCWRNAHGHPCYRVICLGNKIH